MHAFSGHALFTTVLPEHVRLGVFSLLAGSYVAKVLVGVGTLIDDIRRGLLFLIRRLRRLGTPASAPAEKGISRSQFISVAAVALGGAFLATIIHGFSNQYAYRVRRVSLRFPHLPDAFKGMKVLQVSDFHTGSFDDPDKVKRGIDLILWENEDVIFFNSDLVNDRASEELEPYRSMYAQIQAPLGVYATLGNHDYGDYVHWPSEAAKQANLETLKSL